MLLFRDFLNSSSSSVSSGHQFHDYNNSLASSIPLLNSYGGGADSNSSGSSSVKMNNHDTCVGVVEDTNGNKITETDDEENEEFEFFKPSDSGLLEEIVHRFLPKSKPKKRDITPPKPESFCNAELFPPPVSSSDNHVLLSTAQCYDEKKKGFPENHGFGYVSLDEHQGFPMQQFDTLNNGFSFNAVEAVPPLMGNDQQVMMNHAGYNSTMEDIFQYPDLLNAFAVRMQNA